MNIAHWLLRAANACSQNAALQTGDAPAMSYREFARRVAASAQALRDLGGMPGDRVALIAGNRAECLVALYAAWWAGCAAVPVNAKLHAREAAFILADAGVRVCFASSEWVDSLSGVAGELPMGMRIVDIGGREFADMQAGEPMAPAARAPGDLAWLFYTSGTTGRPKGAMLSHRNLAAMTFNYFSDVDAIAVEDAILHAAPVSHGSGLYNFAHVLRGARQVFPASGGFDPAEIVALLPAQPGLSMFAAPTMVKRLTEHVARAGLADAAARHLKTIVYGGGPMYTTDLKQALAAFGNKFVQIYGQGETPMTITALSRWHHADTAHPRHEQRLASVGLPHSGIELRICDEHGVALPAGETGEICVKGDTVMSGYWNNPEASAQSLRDGWLWTGDLGALDADGFLTLKDRSKDLIISGGSNIYPREVEEVLLELPEVAEVSVVGRPDSEWGEAVVAFVVARPGAPCDVARLDAHCLAKIARFKRPKEYRFVEALPKNNYGKVLKTELRKQM